MAFVRHGTLVADTVTSVTLPDRSISVVEVTNRDGAAEIYFLVQAADKTPVNPEVEGDDCELLPASMNSLEVNAPDPSPAVVRMISSGTPTYSVRAE